MKIKVKTETHIHEGKPVPSGTILDVDEPTGKHFIEVGAADPVKGGKDSE